jgi:hypothetical protein
MSLLFSAFGNASDTDRSPGRVEREDYPNCTVLRLDRGKFGVIGKDHITNDNHENEFVEAITQYVEQLRSSYSLPPDLQFSVKRAFKNEADTVIHFQQLVHGVAVERSTIFIDAEGSVIDLKLIVAEPGSQAFNPNNFLSDGKLRALSVAELSNRTGIAASVDQARTRYRITFMNEYECTVIVDVRMGSWLARIDALTGEVYDVMSLTRH